MIHTSHMSSFNFLVEQNEASNDILKHKTKTTWPFLSSCIFYHSWSVLGLYCNWKFRRQGGGYLTITPYITQVFTWLKTNKIYILWHPEIRKKKRLFTISGKNASQNIQASIVRKDGVFQSINTSLSKMVFYFETDTFLPFFAFGFMWSILKST